MVLGVEPRALWMLGRVPSIIIGAEVACGFTGCVCMGRPEVNFRCRSLRSVHFDSWDGVSGWLAWNSTPQAGLAGHRPQGSVFLPPQQWAYKHLSLAFYVGYMEPITWLLYLFVNILLTEPSPQLDSGVSWVFGSPSFSGRAVDMDWYHFVSAWHMPSM